MTKTHDRIVPFVLLCLTAFLAVFPLFVSKPGLPLTFKADEPAYYLMALSLARDGDLECNLEDRRRAIDEFPHLPANNLIAMTDDGWRTIFFGKPYLYSLLAAPMTHWFGANGMMSFNMLLLMAMVGMGTCYLRRYNNEGLAALFAGSFFIVSSSFSYVFWLHPEIFMAFGVCTCLYFGLVDSESRPQLSGWWQRLRGFCGRPVVRASISAAGLAAATYHKPMLAIVGVPVLGAFVARKDWKQATTWLVAAVLAMGVFAGLAYVETGHPSAYLGVQRAAFRVGNPDAILTPPQSAEELEELKTKNSWTWLWRLPDIKPAKTLSSIGSFIWGRHVGLLPYMPFSVLAILLFLWNGRSSRLRWALLASTAALALFFIIWIPFNWHGGSGFVGNRYFVPVYPAFLFLVTKIRPRWSLVPALAFGAALLGVVVFQPLGLPVRNPTLQAHARGKAFQWFPLETTVQPRVPGYRGQVYEGVWFRASQEAIQFHGTEMWLYGNMDHEVWMVTSEPITEPVLFEVRSLAAVNDVTLELGDDRLVVQFAEGDPSDNIQIVELQPNNPRPFRQVRVEPDDAPPGYIYTLRVHPRTGHVPRDGHGGVTAEFYLGAGLRYLGTRDQVHGDDAFNVEWLACEAPAIVSAGDSFRAEVTLRNAAPTLWPRHGLTRVALSYHWYQDDQVKVFEGTRTRLADDVEAGAETGASMKIDAPGEPGTYRLSIDLVREGVAWFSSRNGNRFCEATVEVVPAS